MSGAVRPSRGRRGRGPRAQDPSHRPQHQPLYQRLHPDLALADDVHLGQLLGADPVVGEGMGGCPPGVLRAREAFVSRLLIRCPPREPPFALRSRQFAGRKRGRSALVFPL